MSIYNETLLMAVLIESYTVPPQLRHLFTDQILL